MPDKNDFSEILAELLQGQDRLNGQITELRKENKDNSDRMINAFNTFATAVLTKMDSIDKQLTKMANFEDRIKRLEDEVFKK
jgi:hypothetical protein